MKTLTRLTIICLALFGLLLLAKIFFTLIAHEPQLHTAWFSWAIESSALRWALIITFVIGIVLFILQSLAPSVSYLIGIEDD